jgi:tRNA(His) guanylyltransferase
MEQIIQDKSTMLNEKLGDRMKKYESMIDNQIVIKPCESFIIRLDGRSFSKFTKKFHKPFDIVFVKAMGLTTL